MMKVNKQMVRRLSNRLIIIRWVRLKYDIYGTEFTKQSNRLILPRSKICEWCQSQLTRKNILLHGFMAEEQLLERLSRKGKSQKNRENRRYLEKHIKNTLEKCRMSWLIKSLFIYGSIKRPYIHVNKLILYYF